MPRRTALRELLLRTILNWKSSTKFHWLRAFDLANRRWPKVIPRLSQLPCLLYLILVRLIYISFRLPSYSCMDCIYLSNQALYVCAINKLESEHSEDLGAKLVDFTQRYLDPMRILVVEHGTVPVGREQPMNEVWKGERCFISPCGVSPIPPSMR
jgi:hypothetical protein